ncbi:bifunctional DNA primase/polymerase [Mesorhizobium sp. ESP6-5]|uniref:bifunctional DNA primase/polymerase n=1 Tax=Mesorhizobium sp. ESP6-5 TaxID=2876623 RepID=UPI001CCED6A4|nr:bifunctional DNA primase/polymerase [Mesorhizobium sp. ESP6-5]MBZ9755270.1 bifunctional DNA primase/polymerase [Mesorhizobium sp. ESP6-5]
MQNEAIKLAETFGFRILPVASPRMGGPAAGKRPLIPAWQQAATTDPVQIGAWFSRWPIANIGIATGAQSGVVVLDVDHKNGGMESLERLRQEIELPETLTAKSGSGGLHFYYRYPLDEDVRNSAGKLGPGLDIRGEGGFIVAPPSMHACGQTYEWVNL